MCFDPANAVRMASLLAVLTDLYLDRAACETRANEKPIAPVTRP